MQIQVNADKNIEGGERLTQYVKSAVDAKLRRFVGQITRVEAHLSDESGHKTHGDDKKCVLEARPAGRNPIAVTHMAATLDQAITGAVDKLERVLDSTFAQLNNPKSVPAPAPVDD
jgi:ribosome-associated translation inhibitor RaiA